MAKKITTPQAKLNVQHDYITLKLPVGNFTTSFRGAKASGQLCQMKGAFEALDKYVQTALLFVISLILRTFIDLPSSLVIIYGAIIALSSGK